MLGRLANYFGKLSEFWGSLVNYFGKFSEFLVNLVNFGEVESIFGKLVTF